MAGVALADKNESSLRTGDAALEKSSPPGPRGLPWFGNLRELRANPMAFFTRIAREYGGIATFQYGRKRTYLVSDPALIRELLIVNRDKYRKNIRYPAMQRILGQGLLLSEGALWKAQRLMTQPSFRPSQLVRQVGWMADVVAGFVERLDDLAYEGKSLDMHLEFLRLAQYLSGTLSFGPGFDAHAEELFEISERLRRSWPSPPRGLLDSFKPPSLLRLRRLDRSMRELDALVLHIIKSEGARTVEEDSILGRLMHTSEREGNRLSDAELRDQMITLVVAGYETTAASLSWTHYLLDRHPQVRERLEEEVDAATNGAPITCSTLENLPLVERVLQESLRLYSPIHSLSRVALEDNYVGGYLIPKDSTVVVSLYATHRLPECWEEPERFDPDRFLPERVSERANHAYIPFAAGHRNCIGGTLAMLEIKLILASIAQRFRLELAPDFPVEPVAGTTMYPRHGMLMTVRASNDKRARRGS